MLTVGPRIHVALYLTTVQRINALGESEGREFETPESQRAKAINIP
jgi:hypothetical protein